MKNCPAEPRGWGEDIQWSSYLEGLRLGRETRKPIMLIVHKTWCGPCRALFPQCRRVYSENMRFESDRLYFVRNNCKSVEELSKNFIMVNCEDDEEPEHPSFKPDGSYYPRIMFLEPRAGMVDTTLFNRRGVDTYKYFYRSAEEVREGMQRALAKHEHGVEL